MNIYNLIILAEKCILFFIALLTVFSVGAEMFVVIQNGKIALTDLLLMFIYAEVLGMVAAFYQYRKIPITLPIFIAITALCRLMILQGKGISTIDLIYEGCAVLLLAVSTLVIQYGLVLSKNNEEKE
jgi:protein PsiE